MQSAFRRRCTASMRAVNEEIGLIFVSVTRIWFVAAHCEGALLAPHTYSGTMKTSLFKKRFKDKLLMNFPKVHYHHHGQRGVSQKEVLYQIAKKYSQELIFLPPYSPEYNPIEYKRGALKQNIAGCVHLYDSISQALNAVLEGN